MVRCVTSIDIRLLVAMALEGYKRDAGEVDPSLVLSSWKARFNISQRIPHFESTNPMHQLRRYMMPLND